MPRRIAALFVALLALGGPAAAGMSRTAADRPVSSPSAAPSASSEPQPAAASAAQQAVADGPAPAAAPAPSAIAAVAGTESVACTDASDGVVEFTLPVGGGDAHGFYALPASAPQGIVLFSHGYGHSSYSWRAHLARVAASLDVIAIAVDGRGLIFNGTFKSDGVTPNTDGWPVMEAAEDGIAATSMFEAACPDADVIVNYGVSLGGNTSGIVAASNVRRADGSPLFDWWVDIEGVNNLVETYLEASAAQPKTAREIEAQAGGTPDQQPEAYRLRTNVARAADMKAAGLRGVVLVQGVDDGLVPYNQSQEMFAALTAAGIPAQYFTVTLKDADSESETTLSNNVGRKLDPAYVSPLAGHASEMSTTHIVGQTGFERLDAIFAGRPPSCTRLYWVDGRLGGAPAADDPAYAC